MRLNGVILSVWSSRNDFWGLAMDAHLLKIPVGEPHLIINFGDVFVFLKYSFGIKSLLLS